MAREIRVVNLLQAVQRYVPGGHIVGQYEHFEHGAFRPEDALPPGVTYKTYDRHFLRVDGVYRERQGNALLPVEGITLTHHTEYDEDGNQVDVEGARQFVGDRYITVDPRSFYLMRHRAELLAKRRQDIMTSMQPWAITERNRLMDEYKQMTDEMEVERFKAEHPRKYEEWHGNVEAARVAEGARNQGWLEGEQMTLQELDNRTRAVHAFDARFEEANMKRVREWNALGPDAEIDAQAAVVEAPEGRP